MFSERDRELGFGAGVVGVGRREAAGKSLGGGGGGGEVRSVLSG